MQQSNLFGQSSHTRDCVITYNPQGCQVARDIKESVIAPHIEECVAICSVCFLVKRELSRKRRYVRLITRRPQRYTENIEEAELARQVIECSHRGPMGGRPLRYSVTKPRLLCALCSEADDETIRTRRGEKEMSELVHMAPLANEQLHCYLCHRHMKSTRWWICSLCGCACYSNVHKT